MCRKQERICSEQTHARLQTLSQSTTRVFTKVLFAAPPFPKSTAPDLRCRYVPLVAHVLDSSLVATVVSKLSTVFVFHSEVDCNSNDDDDLMPS